MEVIHFAEGSTDPLHQFRAFRARFVPLAQGGGETHISCLHLLPGGSIPKLPTTQHCALLTVHGAVTFDGLFGTQIEISGGMGLILYAGEPCALHSQKGAILLLIECQRLEPDICGLSTPQRVTAHAWPPEAAVQLANGASTP